MWSKLDVMFMQRALELAALGGSFVAPNPMVGAVIVHEKRIIGEGFHRSFGGPHAEVNAINAVKDKALLKEATIYVTLEPCAHHGKTPPCANLLIENKFKRVVISGIDPFAQVAGRGVSLLKDAGIEVEIGLLRSHAQALNKFFFHFQEYRQPYVLLKWAETSNALMATNDGYPSWISGDEIAPFNHQLRAKSQAILIGYRTALFDNPKLNCRSFPGKTPLRFVVDPHCKLPNSLNLFKDGNKTVVICQEEPEKKHSNAVYILMKGSSWLETAISFCANKQIQSLIIEGGAKTLQQVIAANQWNEAWRIRSKQVLWESGLEAPKIQGKPFEIIDFGTDWLYRYFNIRQS